MLGLVTIGQSPREDVVTSMFGGAKFDTIIEAGALDDLDRDEIAELVPNLDDQPLVTRLRDGSEVIIGKRHVLPHLERAMARLEAVGCTTICVLCTGEFPPLPSRSLVVYPDRVVTHIVEALIPEGMLGVLMPHAGQREGMVAKWTTPMRSTITGVASPYSARDAVATETSRLVEAGANAIVLDCMGFDRRMLDDARTATMCPVILSNAIVGSVLREVVGTSIGLLNHPE